VEQPSEGCLLGVAIFGNLGQANLSLCGYYSLRIPATHFYDETKNDFISE
jgi:hypothetical protein